MITKVEYERIQRLLGRKLGPRPKTYYFPYTGMIRCAECGAQITAETKHKTQKNGNQHSYTYYRCTKRKDPNCSQKTIREEELERQISDILFRIEIPEDFRVWALNVVKEENKSENQTIKRTVEANQRAYNASLAKIERLIDMRASGELTPEEFVERKSKEEQEKSRLFEILECSEDSSKRWYEQIDQLLSFAEAAMKNFERGTQDQKKAILSALGSNLSLKDRKLSICLTEPLKLMEIAHEEVKELNKRLEPLKNGLKQQNSGQIYAQSPILLEWKGAFRTNNWEKVFPDPYISTRQIRYLLSLG